MDEKLFEEIPTFEDLKQLFHSFYADFIEFGKFILTLENLSEKEKIEKVSDAFGNY